MLAASVYSVHALLMVIDLWLLHCWEEFFFHPISNSEFYGSYLLKIIIVVLWFAGCWEEDSAGCVSEKRKRPSSADTDGGGGRESKKPLAAANGTRAP